MKSFWRKEIKARLLSLQKKGEKEEKINSFLRLHPLCQTAKKIAVFLPSPLEPNIVPWIKEGRKEGKSFYVPCITGEGTMDFVLWEEDTPLQTNRYGISEPKGIPYQGKFDLILVPLVAFDKNKNRLGHGKGYYDRFLSQNSTPTIGVAFSCQEIDSVPCDRHDVPLGDVVTENRLLSAPPTHPTGLDE